MKLEDVRLDDANVLDIIAWLMEEPSDTVYQELEDWYESED